jgi:hypothetical protein
VRPPGTLCLARRVGSGHALVRPSRVRSLSLLTVAAIVSLSASSLAAPEADQPAKGAPPAAQPRINPGAQLPGGRSASEYWDLTISLDSGHRVVTRFMITNVGPGSGNGVAVGFVIAPDGSTTQFRNGRQKSGWSLSRNGLRLDVGKSHLHLDPPRQRLQVRKGDVKLDLTFVLGSSVSIPSDLTSKQYRIDLLGLAVPIEGSLWLAGMADPLEVTGRLTLTHTISRAREADLALRRIEIFSEEGPVDFYAVDLMNPEGESATWMALRDRSGAESAPDSLITRRDFHVTLAIRGPSLIQSGSKTPYPMPKKLILGNSEVKGSVLFGDQILRHDPLEDLPQPFRFIVGRASQPRRVWSEAGIEVTIGAASGREPRQVQGNGVTAVSFLNPLTRP